jgi:arylsulfatase A
MNKLFIPGSAVLLALSSCTCPFSKDNNSVDQPSIIYILADDMGYGDLGCYGQKQIKTPNIDQLASEGMLFTQHYAGSTVCAPSRGVLMTGRHTGNAYIRDNRGIPPMGQFPLADSIITVAEFLKNAGYATGSIGKWGLGGPGSEGDPARQGFDYFYGYKCQSHAHNFYPEFVFRNNDTVTLRNKLPEPVATNQTGFATVRIDYTPDLFAKEAVSFVTRHKDQPFFLYLALTPPHVNNEAPVGLGMEVPEQGEYAGMPWPEVEKDKAAMITRMDRDIGKLIQTLKELGIDKSTLVIFSSDNGPHKEGGVNPEFHDSNGPLRGTKRDLYEGGIRVPMIAWWPEVIKSGSVSHHISAFWDILPTFCELAGIEIPEDTDGISFVNELKGKTQKEHEYLYWEYPTGVGKTALRYKNWKAVKPNLRDKPELTELYDLNSDLGEQSDISAENPEILNLMVDMMESAHTPSTEFPLIR